MRTSFRPALWVIALIFSPALGAASRPVVAPAPARASVALPASEPGSDASVPLPATLTSGMGYRAFAQAMMEQGWQLVDPLAADSCMAAGDCEVEFIAPGGSARLRVQVGSQAGAAVVQSWLARQVPLDRIGNPTAAAGDAKPASAGVHAGNNSR
ncbi:hypothetical protein KWM_0109290 [Xanthomonas vasicola pv. musacearum NCPPB 2005]|uniref:hypothetical protein n=1 Tax=Xanthomonas vasicola TaxID=56459 RepID=UPI000477B7DF|nr:hypothetical protein [Xanthomonas vasicola]KFA10239.1 hypothetical protein KWM_0109290 [Xanthomonas vasicola pv. musacearum NCPPB 2005]MBV6743652.1 hypothetical protein [Xanthomonas vasicola pv. musacearum NCPPB 2251]MBV7288677.1 hypothetical protein [Xanthomonas vasicola pv. musacearum]RJL83254.1 hypothetical protein DEF98_018100 [Xanthomonas vasicola]RJL93806.1 hypothetical protein DEF96_017220 [Xanthomonas vasicola]